MNKEQAVSKFIRENQKLLSSKSCDSDTVKELRKDFFHNNSLAAGQQFATKEVAEAFAEKLVKREWESKEAFVESALKVPYLESAIQEDRLSTIYVSEKGSEDTILTSKDISKISNVEYRQEVEQEFREEAREKVEAELEDTREAIKRIKEEVEAEREELQAYRSELDSLPPEIPLDEIVDSLSEKEDEEDPHPDTEWWEEIGLVNDPFPDNKGLVGIPEELYDEVVVKTSFIDGYINDAHQNPDSLLDKTILITGEFGSGKTTLFEYLESCLGGARVLPVRVFLNPGPSVSSLTDKLYSQLFNRAARVYSQRLGGDPRREAWGEIETKVVEVLRDLQDEELTRGFLVTIDGLHKGKSYQEQVFEFLQQIQNVQEFFQSHGIRVGFVIAGSPRWENKLAGRPSVSGSFYRQDEIPPLPEDAAVEAVERRIQAFTPEDRSPPNIRRDSLRQAFRVIERREPRPVTFRAYLDHVRGRLEAREFEEAGLGVHLHLETIEDVHKALRETALFEKYQGVWTRLLEKPRLRSSVQNILIKILQEEVLPEGSPTFKENLHVFHLLRNHDFITKRKAAEGTVGWSLTPDVAKTLTLVGEDLKIAPDDVLRGAFEEEAAARARESQRIYSAPLERIEEMESSWGDSWPGVVDHLRSAKNDLEEMEGTISQGRPKRLDESALSDTLGHLVRAVNRMLYTEEPDGVDEWLSFEEAWAAPENAGTYLDYRPDSFSLPSNESEIFGVLHQHSRLVSDLLDLMEDLARGENVCRLRGRGISDEDKGAIHKLRMNFLHQNYRGVVEGATRILQERIRTVAYPALRSIWGESARKHIPKDIRKETSPHPAGGGSNFFYDLPTTAYPRVLFDEHVRQAIIPKYRSQADLNSLQEDVELAFSFADQKNESGSESHFRENATSIGNILQALPETLELLNDISGFILEESSFDYTGGGDRPIEATFSSSGKAGPDARPIKVSQEDGKSLTITFLQVLSSRPIQAETLDSIGPVSSEAPEVQLTILRILREQGALSIEAGTGPPCLKITEAGREFLDNQ